MSTTLMGLVVGLPAGKLEALSRLIITTGPGESRVMLHFAHQRWNKPEEIKDGALRPLSGPRRLDEDAPDAVVHSFEPTPDDTCMISSGGLPEQIDELQLSGIVGGLLVERLGDGRKIVISTHAETQAERNAWLASVSK